MTSQTIKAAKGRLDKFEAVRVYSYAAQRDLWGYGFRVTKRAGVCKVGK